MEKILDHCGIQEYDLLISSADYGYMKHSGELFSIYLEKIGQKNSPKECLHVGDNHVADGLSPIKYGIRSFTFGKAIDNYSISKINNVLPVPKGYSSITQSILSGFISNKYFGNHHRLINFDSLFSLKLFNAGYLSLGPLLFGFTTWLYSNAKKQKLKKLYFLARDGWLLKQYFDILYPDSDIETCYLYCSRRAFKYALLETEQDIIELYDLYFETCKLTTLLEVRYFLQLEDIPKKLLEKYKFHENSLIVRTADRNKIIPFLRELAPIILEKSKVARTDYIEYLNSVGFTDNMHAHAVVDVGYGASMQLNFMSLLNTDVVNGYYLLTRSTHQTRTKFSKSILEGYISSLDDCSNSLFRHEINNYIEVLESMLSSPEGSFLMLEKRENGFYFNLHDVDSSSIRIERFRELEKGALAFVSDIKERLPSFYENYFVISPRLGLSILMGLYQAPLKKDAELFVDIEFEDELIQNSSYLVSIDPSITEEERLRLSAWKEAVKLFFKEKKKPQNGTKITQISETTSVKKNSGKESISERKFKKLREKPYMFFRDSSNIFVRPFAFLFMPNTKREKISKKILFLFLNKKND